MSTSNHYLVVHPDGNITEGEGMLSQQVIAGMVGGAFEVLPCPELATVFACEDGKLDGLPYNWLATTWLRPVMHPNDTVVGNIIVAGPPDGEGEVTDVGPEVAAHLQELAHTYQSRLVGP